MATSGSRDAADADSVAATEGTDIPTALPGSVDQVSAPATMPPPVTPKLSWQNSCSSMDDAALEEDDSPEEPAKEQAQEVRWQWEHRTGFKDYKKAESDRIEAAYQRGAWMIRTKNKEGRKAKPREIYFADMVQYDPGADKLRNVRRIPELGHTAKFSRRVLAMLIGFMNGEDQWWKAKTRDMFEEERFGEVQEKLAEEVAAETYRVDSCEYRVASSWWFNTFAMTMILINSIYIWVDADYNDGSTIVDTPPIFTVVDNMFLIWFLVEGIVRLRSLKKCSSVIKDAWLCLDFALILLMILETWLVQVVVYLAFGSSDSQHLNQLSVLRGLRLLRLARVARLFRVFPQLVVLIKGMVFAMKSLVYTLLLLFVLTFVCAVVFKNLSDMNPELAALHYDSVGGSFWNLLIYGTFLDSVGEMLSALKEINFMYAACLLVFIFISNLTMLNMLIGILCEVIAKVAEEEEGLVDQVDLDRCLFDILDCYDLDNDQLLRKDEFQTLMENPDLKVILDKYSIDLQALTRLQDILFQPRRNEDGSTTFTQLKFSSLVEKVHQLRGGNSATVQDMVELRNWLKRRFNLLEGLDPDTAMRHRPDQGKDAVMQKSPIVAQAKIEENGASTAAFQQAVLSQLDKMHLAQVKMDEELSRLRAKVAALQR